MAFANCDLAELHLQVVAGSSERQKESEHGLGVNTGQPRAAVYVRGLINPWRGWVAVLGLHPLQPEGLRV